MQQADLIIHTDGQLVTCASGSKPKRGSDMLDVGIIENGALAIVDGKFVAVGSSAEIVDSYSSDNIINAGRRVVCPGFADPHTHIVYAGDRLNEFELKIKGADYLDILTKGGGIISTVRHTREAFSDDLVALSNARLDKMSENGTTTVEIKTGYGLDVETELKMLQVIWEMWLMLKVDIVPTFMAAHALPPEFEGRSNAYIDLVCKEMLPKAMKYYRESTDFADQGIPIFADVFCEKGAFDLAASSRVLETAKSLGFGIKAHVDQFTNLGGSKMAIGLGAASIDHLDAISDEEIDLLSKSETVGVVIPTENFNAGKTTFANARKMIDRDCAIALSTDYNPGSAPCPSQPMAMAIACRYQKLLPSETLNASTINAAFAVGLGASHGSIEVGKKADLNILQTTDYREIAYEFGGNLVKTVVKNGEVIHER